MTELKGERRGGGGEEEGETHGEEEGEEEEETSEREEERKRHGRNEQYKARTGRYGTGGARGAPEHVFLTGGPGGRRRRRDGAGLITGIVCILITDYKRRAVIRRRVRR